MLQHPIDRFRREKVCLVLESRLEPVVFLLHQQRQLERRYIQIQFECLGSNAASKRHRRQGRILQREHYLEERRAA